MNSLKTLRLSRAIAGAIAVAGIAASAIGAPLAISTTPNLQGTPDDGMVCRSGYTANFNGTSLKCSKVVTIQVNLECDTTKFATYLARDIGSGGTLDGADICLAANRSATSHSNLVGVLTENTDYVKAVAKQSKIDEKTKTQHDAEVASLGLQAGDVEAVAASPVMNRSDTDASGISDKADVTLTMFTFPIVSGFILR
jgi:hypothetical protein